MINPWQRPARLAVPFALALLACQCEAVTTEIEPPPRPSSVPEKAVWAGGLDGGSYILMSPPAADGTYRTKIYYDHGGDVWFSGKLRLDKPGGSPINVRDPKTFSGWDGDTLYLRDGRTLSPAK